MLPVPKNVDVYKGFKLISLKLTNDKIFGDIEYEFVEGNDAQDGIYTTVIIGPNGTRKSQLFKRIIELYWDLYFAINNEKEAKKYPFGFTMKYAYDDYIYEYTNIDNTDFSISSNTIYVNNQPLAWDYKELKFAVPFPESIVASSVMVNDKFPFPDQDSFPKYEYIGTRFSQQMGSAKTFINRTVDSITRLSENESFINGLNKIVSNFLNTEHSVYVIYYTKNTKLFFTGELRVGDLIEHFEAIAAKYKLNDKKAPFSLDHFNSIRKDEQLLTELVNLVNKLFNEKKLRPFYRSPTKAISYNLTNTLDLDELKVNGKYYTHLRKLGIVHPPEIEFLKPEQENPKKLEGYSLFESSSGEHNLLCSMIGFMASIKHKSLVLIDEPEVSLHPNWQMRYIDTIRELFSNEIYSNCHIIIATHSHFLISDVVEANSKIIGLKRESKLKIVDMPRNYNTFGWSAEQVLLDVFDVQTTRNYAVAENLGELLDFIANPQNDTEAVKRKFFELGLNKLNKLQESDPLKAVYDTIVKEYVSDITK